MTTDHATSTSAEASAAAIDHAARVLEEGGLVAFPTETVYGLGADAENVQAVQKIFAAKGRPSDHPLIVHLAVGADLNYWSRQVNLAAQKLVAAFWPGPLTLILPIASHIPKTATGGQDSIGLRCPAHMVAQALLRSFKLGKGGIAAPSANRFGRISPTTASHVREEFSQIPEVACILEGGQSAIGIESTIVDLTRAQPALLRPGAIGMAQINDVLGQMLETRLNMPALHTSALPMPTLQEPNKAELPAPRVSGSLASHYAPDTPVFLISGEQIQQTLTRLSLQTKRVALMHYSNLRLTNVNGDLLTKTIKTPANATAYAHDLYANLRQLDAANADVILVEALPDHESWSAVNDRLTRAAHGSRPF